MRVLFIVPYPVGKAPSQRFRIEQFFPLLDREHIPYTVAPFMDEKTWNVLYGSGSFIKKVTGVVRGYWRRLRLVLFETGRYNVFVIHREAAPLGPPVFEWILAKLLGKRYIFDFDDAIWVPKVSSANTMVLYLRGFWKIKYLCRWAFNNTAGNRYLEDFAKRSGAKKTTVLPTVVDTDKKYVPADNKQTTTPGKVIIGWTGSHSTLAYLESRKALLEKLKETHDFTLCVIADKAPANGMPHEFVPWNAQSETEQLKSFDIGIMPLVPDAFSEGKCGFKLIQYMSVAVPGIASPTGANADIVDHGINGYICDTDEEWLQALKTLINDPVQRKKMGELARRKIVNAYSIRSQEQPFMNALRECYKANT